MNVNQRVYESIKRCTSDMAIISIDVNKFPHHPFITAEIILVASVPGECRLSKAYMRPFQQVIDGNYVSTLVGSTVMRKTDDQLDELTCEGIWKGLKELKGKTHHGEIYSTPGSV